MTRLLNNFVKPACGHIFAALLACIVLPLFALAFAATMQVAVCPLIYVGRDSPPTNVEARANWNAPGFTDCVGTSFSSAAGIVQKIWK